MGIRRCHIRKRMSRGSWVKRGNSVRGAIIYSCNLVLVVSVGSTFVCDVDKNTVRRLVWVQG